MSRSIKELISTKRRNQIVNFLSANRKKQPIKFILQLSQYLVYAGNNVSYDSSSNGENLLFKKLAKHNFNTIIDCGANTGTNTKVYKIFNNKAIIYAIEAIDETLEKCKEYTKDYSGIHYLNIGLGSERSQVTFKYFPKNNYLSTKYENILGKDIPTVEKTVEIYTGDEFCKENNLQHVNFVKIDVEGMDFEVIKGFKNMIENNQIDAIQFEYCGNFIYSKHFLKDIYDLCLPFGYIIGKIYPNGVEFLNYNVTMEDFQDANYLIIKKDLKDVIEDIKEK